jgi:hypothetical protein
MRVFGAGKPAKETIMGASRHQKEKTICWRYQDFSPTSLPNHLNPVKAKDIGERKKERKKPNYGKSCQRDIVEEHKYQYQTADQSSERPLVCSFVCLLICPVMDLASCQSSPFS